MTEADRLEAVIERMQAHIDDSTVTIRKLMDEVARLRSENEYLHRQWANHLRALAEDPYYTAPPRDDQPL
jgi:regulator of replication initiation timing